MTCVMMTREMNKLEIELLQNCTKWMKMSQGLSKADLSVHIQWISVKGPFRVR